MPVSIDHASDGGCEAGCRPYVDKFESIQFILHSIKPGNAQACRQKILG